MVGKCANRSCSAFRANTEGKLFRLDIELGNIAGKRQHKTDYVWLCAPCAQQMNPKVEVSGDTIIVRLAKTAPALVSDAVRSARVN
jgi:hypothetical protein